MNNFIYFASFTGYHLISYIRSWQKTVASQQAKSFHLNTYEIAMLVIFFLQTKSKLPSLKDLPSSDAECIYLVPDFVYEELADVVEEFFIFYSKKFDANSVPITKNCEPSSNYKPRSINKKQVIVTSKPKRFELMLSDYHFCFLLRKNKSLSILFHF